MVAPDLVGMGRSDKPVSLAEHTYANHVAWTKAFVRAVLADEGAAGRLTLVAQDWGAAIGLRVVADEPSWFARVVVANGRLPLDPLLDEESNSPLPAARIEIGGVETRSGAKLAPAQSSPAAAAAVASAAQPETQSEVPIQAGFDWLDSQSKANTAAGTARFARGPAPNCNATSHRFLCLSVGPTVHWEQRPTDTRT